MLPLLAFLALAGGADAGTSAPKAIALLATDAAVIEKWATLKPAERAKLPGIVDKAKIGDRVSMGILLEGYELPKSRLVDLTCDVLVTDPDGRALVDRVSLAGAKTWDPKVQLALLLHPVGDLYFGTTDPEGIYKIKVTVWDQVRGSKSIFESTFTVSR